MLYVLYIIGHPGPELLDAGEPGDEHRRLAVLRLLGEVYALLATTRYYYY